MCIGPNSSTEPSNGTWYFLHSHSQTAPISNVVLSTCALSGERLADPVVADLLGTLFNRASVLEYILASKHASFSDEQAQHRYINQLREGGAAYDHLRSTSDVFSVTLPPTTAASGAPVHCPVTEVSSDKYPFVALVPCGHVMSQRAIAAVAGQDGAACPMCGAAYDEGVDVVPLAPDGETLEGLRESLARRGDVLRRRRAANKKRRSGDDGTTAKNKQQKR